jgi:PAS domain S-box-containing protein
MESELLDTIIIDTAEILVVVSDREGRIVRFNDGGQRILGYEISEVLGKIVWELLPLPEFRERARQRYLALLTGETLAFESIWLTRSGEQKWFSCHAKGVRGPDGLIDYTVGTAVDITPRVAAETALRESEQHFRTTFDDAAIGMALVDEAGQYIQINRAFCELTGYDLGELRKVDMLAITHPDDRQLNRELFQRLVKGEIPAYVLEKRYIRRDGKTIWVQVSSSLAGGGHGRPATMIGLFENISERRAAREALQRANSELLALNETLEQRVSRRTAQLQEANASLEQANQLLRDSERHYRDLADSNLRLAREVEHRVRNNLQGLLGLIAVMRGRATDVRSFADALEARLSAMRHVHQLLAHAQWTPVGMQALVDGALATLAHMAPFPSTEIQAAGPDVPISPRQVLPLTLVLVEWFTNSCKYGAHSVPGGRVSIRWEMLPEAVPTRIRLTWTERGGPPIAASGAASLGTELVQAFSRRELAGSVELRYPLVGADHVLEFTVREDAALR